MLPFLPVEVRANTVIKHPVGFDGYLSNHYVLAIHDHIPVVITTLRHILEASVLHYKVICKYTLTHSQYPYPCQCLLSKSLFPKLSVSRRIQVLWRKVWPTTRKITENYNKLWDQPVCILNNKSYFVSDFRWVFG
jgi:hypothetical protein